MTTAEWQEMARAVTDPLPPLSARQQRALTRIALSYARRRQLETAAPQAA